ncbi:MAG: chemotaxis protein CheW [Calditrichaeota bacterium]|nr:chemotaxis protein CheW [Calditrichota bacterium]MCB9369666.1 chemotaxis protein CheW [Calditrichota bacterium]
MVAAPPRPSRRAAASPAPATKLVCFRLASWRFALGVDEVVGLHNNLPLIPNTEQGFAGLVQLKYDRIPVIDLRTKLSNTADESLLPAVAVVERFGQRIGLVFDHPDEVISVSPRGLLLFDLEIAPLPARARTTTRNGDVFWLNVNELTKPNFAGKLEKE